MNTKFVNLTSSGAVITGEGVLTDMYVNSTSSGAFKLVHGDGTTYADTGNTRGGVITPAAGYHNLGNIHATAGIYLWGTAGTFDVTLHILEAN
jgi:hypothetical protein